MTHNRNGLTLTESIVVITIIGLLASILISAVRTAREAARRLECQNKLRQIGMALQNHESTFQKLPSLYNGTILKHPRHALDEFHFHSWRTAILPQLELNALYQSIDLGLRATDIANQEGITTEVPVFLCPSTGSQTVTLPDVYDFEGARVGYASRSDYEALLGVHFPEPSMTSSADLRGIKFGAWGEPKYDSEGWSQSYRKATLNAVTDGLSNTLLVGERAGRPDWYRRGKPVFVYPRMDDPPFGNNAQQAAWGISTNIWWLLYYSYRPINDTNSSGIFSFHPGGANVAFGDGSARFMSENTDQEIVIALITRSEGDVGILDSN